MKTVISPIQTYTINEVNQNAGITTEANDFYVFRRDEMPSNQKMFRPSRSTHITVYLHLRGAMELKVNLISYTTPGKCLFVVSPGAVREKVRETDDCDAISLGFTPGFLSRTLLHKNHIDAFGFFASQNDPLVLLTDEEAEHISGLMLSLKKLYVNTDHPFKEEILQHSFSAFMFEIAALFKKYRHEEAVRFTGREDLLMRFIKLLNVHFKEERSVQYYASLLFVTPKHLTKTIKEITYKTCGEIIDEMVIIEAKILLDDHTLSIGNIADELHFSDQFFFSKFFKNHTGITPSDYKATI